MRAKPAIPMRPMRAAHLACALAILVAASLGVPRALAGDRPSAEQVSQALTCQCGCGLTVANCNMPTCGFAVPTRHEIRRMIDQGKSQVEIISFYQRKYGEKVLSAPTTYGFNLLAWTTPFGALLLGGVLIVFTARRWRRAPDTPAPAPAPSDAEAAPFDPELRRKLAEDLRKGG
ncbi:MAG TPA: cytochrome c-type biogenesis protein [Candidatus Binataceae bacterium]|nr:cytochrome c-type biogenesis protein [Candidatus Binataceae bacterium]